MLISAASAWPTYEFGEDAYNPVLTMVDEHGQAWLEAHKERAEQFIYYFYALAILSAVAIFAPIKWRKSSVPLAIAVLLLVSSSWAWAVTSRMPVEKSGTASFETFLRRPRNHSQRRNHRIDNVVAVCL